MTCPRHTPIGITRRVQALLALGHHPGKIAAELPIDEQDVLDVAAGRMLAVDRDARDICRLYEAWCMRPGTCEETRRWARRFGYVPPLAWDEPDEEGHIDNRRARPSGIPGTVTGDADRDLITRVLGGECLQLLRPVDRAEATFLLWQAGLKDSEIARRIGGCRQNVRKVRVRHGWTLTGEKVRLRPGRRRKSEATGARAAWLVERAERDDRVAHLVGKRLSDVRIAERLHLTRRQVRAARQRRGLDAGYYQAAA
jgi:hypothetical protein